jgi:hypothetical protein
VRDASASGWARVKAVGPRESEASGSDRGLGSRELRWRESLESSLLINKAMAASDEARTEWSMSSRGVDQDEGLEVRAGPLRLGSCSEPGFIVEIRVWKTADPVVSLLFQSQSFPPLPPLAFQSESRSFSRLSVRSGTN